MSDLDDRATRSKDGNNMNQVGWVALGSNQNNPQRQVQLAIKKLQQESTWEVTGVSSLYETKPMGFVLQPNYINAVVRLCTGLSPLSLLRRLLELETEQGRVRDGLRWQPRVIDLDLLLLGNEISETVEFQLPHPGLLQREFVLQPMADIDKSWVLPNGKTVAEQLQLLGEKV